MRICPRCSQKLKSYDHYFCSNCATELPQGLYKIPKPYLVNIKLTKEIHPSSKFLFFTIPYEYRFSAKLVSFAILFLVVISILLLINYNFIYGF